MKAKKDTPEIVKKTSTTNTNRKEALGKGIRSLLQNINNDLSVTEKSLSDESGRAKVVNVRIPLHLIEPNPGQPRHDFDETALSELAASIKMHDIIQPITVFKMAEGKYKIIAGERRFREAKIAGLPDVPVYIQEASS